MSVIAVIDDSRVVKRVLEHTGEWNGLPSFQPASIRGSPPGANPEINDGVVYEEFLMDGINVRRARMRKCRARPWMA